MTLWLIGVVSVALLVLPLFKPIRYFLSKHRLSSGFLYSLTATFLGVYLSIHLSNLEERERMNAHVQEILGKIKDASVSLLKSSGRYAILPKAGANSYYGTLQPERIRGYLALDEAKLELSSRYLITINNVLDTLEENIFFSKSEEFNIVQLEYLYCLVKKRTQELIFLTALEGIY